MNAYPLSLAKARAVLIAALCATMCSLALASNPSDDFGTEDLGVTAIIAPVSSCNLGAMELITVTVTNFSSTTVNNLSMGYKIDGAQFLEMTTLTVPANGSATYNYQRRADFSEIRDYELELFTAELDDCDHSNDTLFVTVTHQSCDDISLSDFETESDRICATSQEFTAELTNLGMNTLTTATLQVLVNGSLISSEVWNGNLAQGESEIVTLLATGLLEGDNDIEGKAILPNGNTDDDQSNNSAIGRIFRVPNGISAQFNLTLDNNPAQTSWTIEENGIVIYSGGVYAPSEAGNTIVIDMCLDETLCYDLTLNDSGGDGICCSSGNGMATVTNGAGELLFITDGEYGAQLMENFCAERVCILSASAESTVESQSGAMDGTITVTPVSGTGTIMYSIDGGVTFQTSNVFTGLSEGDYTIIVRDELLCEVSVMIAVEGCDVTFTVEVRWASEAGANDGSIRVTASGGEEPYEYSRDGGVTYQPGSFFRNVLPGEYTVVVRDAQGCMFSMVVVVPACGITAVITTTPESTGNMMDGTISIVASDAAAPVRYSIDGGVNYQSSPDFSDLDAGTYQVMIIDDNLCDYEETITVDECNLVIEASFTPETGFNENDATITINVISGNEPYEYSIDGGVTFQASNFFGGLSEGRYDVVVRDGLGCEAFGTVVIFLCDLSITITPENASAPDAADGRIIIDAMGGAPPYIYSNDGGFSFQNSNIFENLTPGRYVIIVRDNFGCEVMEAVIVGSCNLLVTITTEQASGPTQNDGSISVTASGGTEPYEYSIDGGVTFQSSGDFVNVAGGMYTVVVRDAEGCMGTEQAEVESCNLMLSAATTNSTGPDSTDGSIVVTATNGTPPYLYSIDGGSSFQSSNVFTELLGGSYTILVRDNAGCENTVTARIDACSIDIAVTFTIASTDESEDGSITITPGGGRGPYIYSIDDGDSFQADSVFTDLPSGPYVIRVVDLDACGASLDFELPDCFFTAGITIRPATAEDAEDGLLVITGREGNPPYIYSIDGGTTFQDSGRFENLGIGFYDVVIRDSLGCELMATAEIDFDVAVQVLGADSPISVYPNPVSDLLYIKSSTSTSTQTVAALYRMTGTIVSGYTLTSERAGLLTMDLNSIAAGAYLLYLQQGEEIYVTKVMVQ